MGKTKKIQKKGGKKGGKTGGKKGGKKAKKDKKKAKKEKKKEKKEKKEKDKKEEEAAKKAGGQQMTCIPTPNVKPKVALSSKDQEDLAKLSTTAAQITAEYLSEPSFADYALF